MKQKDVPNKQGKEKTTTEAAKEPPSKHPSALDQRGSTLGAGPSKLDLQAKTVFVEAVNNGMESFQVARSAVDYLLLELDHQLLVNSILTKIKPYGILEVVNIMASRVSKFQIDYESDSRD
jgi:hypothetical protein